MRRSRALERINLGPTDRIPHWEHFSNPDFEQLVTGLDPWTTPKNARARLLELLPLDVGDVPLSDDSLPRLPENETTFTDADGSRAVRWGTGKTWHWNWGGLFKSIADVLAYDPAAHPDQRGAGIVAELDYSLGVEDLAAQLQGELDASRAATGDRALVVPGYYNTLFMWPLLTFGWELFLELGALHKEEIRRLLAGFAARSRLVFQAWARTDVEVITSHDDICFRAGPVFSPAWLREMIYPYYEEFWSYPRASGIKVVFISDGNVDQVADDIFACGADGIASEPYTNWEELARRHPDKIMLGDGDSRVLAFNDRDAAEAMVRRMASFGKRYPGYFMCCGNHLPWNLTAESIQWYFAASEKYARI